MKTIDKLIMMANQIAANLAHEPDPALATAEHIRLFWDPGMRRSILENGNEGLSPTAEAAVMRLTAPSTSADQD